MSPHHARRTRLLVRALDLVVVATAGLVLIVLALDRIEVAAFGARLRVSGAGRPAIALLLAVVARWLATRSLAPARRGPRADTIGDWASLGFGSLALAWTIICLYSGVRVCGGLDSYGYVGAATRIVAGSLAEDQPIAALLPFPEAPHAAAPLGFVVGADGVSRVPRFPLGLPLVMAAFRIAGPGGPFWVPLVMAMLTLGLAFAIARRDGDALSGMFAASIVGLSPTFVNAAIQPMSDVPAACWMVAAAAFALTPWRAPAAAGACAGMAVLTRPALLPAALALIGLVAWRAFGPHRAPSGPAVSSGGQGISGPARDRLRTRDVVLLSTVAALFVAAHAVLNLRLYGSATTSGYGFTSELLHPARAWTNLLNFSKWISYTHTVLFWAAWGAGLVVLRHRAWPFQFSTLALAVAAPYFLYFTWNDWESTRFLLPGLALVLIVTARGVDELTRRLTPTWRPLLLLALALACGGASYRFLARHSVFDLWRAEAKYPLVGAWFRDRTPARAVVISALHSGSLRYYAGRETVRWDVIPEHHLAASVRSLVNQGRLVYLALDVPSEQERFNGRFRDELPHLSLIPRARVADAHIYELRPRRPAG